MTTPATLQVHSIFYGNDTKGSQRGIAALARSVELARTDGLLGRTVLSLGDCSPEPVFTDAEVSQMATEHRSQGIDGIDYCFFDENLGSAGGHNRLLEKLESDYVLILNPDTTVAPNLVAELLQPFREQRRVGLVEARQLPFEHPKPYDPLTGETPWATTACALVHADVIHDVGTFDSESFFLYCDDVDWSWRIRLKGYRLILRDSARLFHDKRLNDDDGSWVVGQAEEYYSAEAALMMAHKWGRPDLVQKYSTDLREFGSDLQRKAVDTFNERRDAGTLPAIIPHAKKVATFVDGGYATHRF